MGYVWADVLPGQVVDDVATNGLGNTVEQHDALIASLQAQITQWQPGYAFLTASVPYTNVGTVQPVTDLTLPAAAGHTYELNAHLYASSAANNQGDIQYALSFPALAVVDWTGFGLHNSLASGTTAGLEGIADANQTTGQTVTIPYGCSTTPTHTWLTARIVMGATAGNVQMMASQFVAAAATTSTLLIRSYMTLRMLI